MIPEHHIRTAFERSVHVEHVGVSAPWLQKLWVVHIEPKDHPTLRDSLMFRLTREQVERLIASFIYLDPTLGAHARKCEEARAWLIQRVFGDTSNASQSFSADGTPKDAASAGGNDVLPASKAATSEAGS
jgi:hypothetical protein